MADKMAAREPGDSGSMNGQIKTPMSSTNTGNKGDGKVHSFKSTMNTDAPGGKAGGTIAGPGAKGSWTGSKTITGTNTGKY